MDPRWSRAQGHSSVAGRPRENVFPFFRNSSALARLAAMRRSRYYTGYTKVAVALQERKGFSTEWKTFSLRNFAKTSITRKRTSLTALFEPLGAR
jgi:hypothetical protein